MIDDNFNGPLAQGFKFLSEALGEDASWLSPIQEGQQPIWMREKMIMEPYVTVEVVACLLQLNLFTVYKMAQRKQIPSYKFGKSVRFRLSEVENYIRKK